ncbi:hypothetical protein F511_14091 [Dorcoceras hygrometricum]|uniref:Uncharacterized protein n=1 Tax=Dorcoceras hygrometricum TaxID=472368 RepID=A0A2Z7BN51_9LAMI|nr:hypothetical protein F511_14091 [Dorcoceras hygrometricum]
MKRRRAEESADGLALMTSSVTSSYSADGLREQSQESAGSLLIQTQERSDVVEEEIQSQAIVHQQIVFGDSDGKRCRLHNSRKLQWIQSQRKDFQTQCLSTQTQEDKSIVVEEDSGEAIDKPDASNSSINQSTGMNEEGGRVDESRDVGATTAQLQKYIDYTVHQQRENEKKDEAIDRH